MTNAHGIRVAEQIRRICGDDDALAFEAALPLSKSADYIKKFDWAKRVCDYLEDRYPPEQIRRIRLAGSCRAGDGEKDKTRAIYESAADAEDFCAKYNRQYGDVHSVEYADGIVNFTYPACYCSCVKRAEETISRIWCLCSVGYVKDLFDCASGRDVGVELVESVKTGGSRCVFRLNGLF